MSFPSDFQTIQTAVMTKARLDVVNDLAKTKDWINQVYYQACIETEFYEASSASAALAANASSVSVPAALVVIEYIVPVGVDGSLYGPMDQITFEEILEKRAWAGGTQTTGAPTRYAFRSASTTSIEFWPNANGGETLTFYGAQLPTALSANGDLPIFPEPYASKVLEYGALCQAAEFKKDIFFLQTYQSLYQEWVARLRALQNTRGGAKVQQFKVERLMPYPKGNSVDQGA